MIGERRGVGILEKEPLNLVFNNGRLFLNWQDKLLTPNSGAYTSLLISNKWYSSLQADWEVKRENENKLVATGKFYQLALTQTWRLELTDNYEIRWDIEMNLQGPLEIQEGCTNIMLTNEYINWFTALEKGEFPLIEYKDKNWQGLLGGDISRRCIGVESKETPNGKIPSLIFKQSQYIPATSAQILNTDYLSNCRVMQYKTLELHNYSSTQANHLIYFSGGILLDIPDIDSYLNNLEDEFILSNGKLKLTFDNGRCILGYNGIDLTKANHINTGIYANGRWYFSNSTHWEVKKDGKNKLIAIGKWAGLPVSQIWQLELKDNFSIFCKIGLYVEHEINIEQQNVAFAFSEGYKYWLTTRYGEGEFPPVFLKDEVVMLQRCISNDIVALQSEDVKLPTIFLKFSDELNNFGLIFNSNFYNKTRILRVDRVEPETNTKFLPGEHPCFCIEASLNTAKRKNIDSSRNLIEKEKLKFVFEEGKGRMFWDGVELTKGLCLYTSVRSQSRWHDSASWATWKVEEKNKYMIKVLGEWFYLPLIQLWEIRLMNEKTIEFKVKMKITKKMEADRLQTNIMLLERYTQWLANKEMGEFPLFRPDIGDEWYQIRSRSCDAEGIGVLKNYEDGKRLPSVLFFSEPAGSQCYLNVVNSDIYHRGRVLQFLNAKENTFALGEYPYFHGKIVIDV